MSRSNPTNDNPNPSTRWFEWNGEHGNVRYYDKERKENIAVGLPFSFLLLDQLACVKGWHDASDSAIFSNEVRSTRDEILVVRSFKGGILAQGYYADIRARICALGGNYVANCYIAYRDAGGQLQIGSIQFKGAALRSWMDFSKSSRKAMYEMAIKIAAFDEGKKGKVVFRTPVFTVQEIGEEAAAQAIELDKQLQVYLSAYLAKPKSGPPSEEQLFPQAGGREQAALDEAEAKRQEAIQTQKDIDEFDDSEIPF